MEQISRKTQEQENAQVNFWEKLKDFGINFFVTLGAISVIIIAICVIMKACGKTFLDF